jgi:mycothiol synthase
MDSLEVTVSSRDASAVHEIARLVEHVSHWLGRAALSEHKQIELDHRAGAPPGDVGTIGVVGMTGPAGMVIARRGGELIGYAHLSGDPKDGRFALELVVDDVPGSGREDVRNALMAASFDRVAALGGGSVRFWAAEAGDEDDSLAGTHGFHLERELIQMRCSLPLPPEVDRSGHSGPVRTRPFRPGLDEEAWLATNNRAFASHPEQGNWTLTTLLDREREAWFDPEGLLLLEHQGRMAGSCWTKVHSTTSPPMGEIYVIGVDPDFHGRGWGRALTAAGLDWLAGRGLMVGMLYVDAENRAAVSLYRSMGFATDHVDRAYVRTVD